MWEKIPLKDKNRHKNAGWKLKLAFFFNQKTLRYVIKSKRAKLISETFKRFVRCLDSFFPKRLDYYFCRGTYKWQRDWVASSNCTQAYLTKTSIKIHNMWIWTLQLTNPSIIRSILRRRQINGKKSSLKKWLYHRRRPGWPFHQDQQRNKESNNNHRIA